MRRVLGIALVVLCVTSGGAQSAPTVSKLLLGHTGDPARFQAQTGQKSVVRSVFLGWGQGSTWGAPLTPLLRRSGPVPMIHVGTLGPNGREAITPRGIAAGRGDAFLVALNQGISAYGGLVYVRVMAEMNHFEAAYAAFRADGTSRGPEYAPSAHASAFRRFHILLRGGTRARVGDRLRAAGLAGYTGPDLAVLSPAKVLTIWNPLGGGLPSSPANAPAAFYPGDAFVDLVGNDLYGTSSGWAKEGNEALYRFARSHGKPFAIPEWGLEGVDDPSFVEDVCAFVKRRPATVLAAYFAAQPGSPYDLGTKPRSRARYRACVTPLAAPAPAGAGGQSTAPPGPAQMRIVADPNGGPAPLDVSFALTVDLPQPVVRWQVAFGDGAVAQGEGEPPTTVDHAYAKDGVYEAVLIAYLAPPFTGTAIRLLTKTVVRVGEDPGVVLRLVAVPRSGLAPLKVVFRPTVSLGRPVVRWQLLYGDGLQTEGTGAPGSFLGHTYPRKGRYRAVLIVYLAPPFTGTAVRFLTYADVQVT